jgi:hypothetical protein
MSNAQIIGWPDNPQSPGLTKVRRADSMALRLDNGLRYLQGAQVVLMLVPERPLPAAGSRARMLPIRNPLTATEKARQVLS